MNIYIESAHDIIHETNVDFVLRPCSKEVHLVQYDLTLPIVKVNLYKNGERYVLPNDVEANVRFGKLDHTFVYKAVLGCNEERNAIYFQVDEQMTLIAGRVSPTIELKWEYNNTTGFANSSPIPVVITRNPIQESDVESSSYAPLFIEVLLQVDDLRERVENMEAVVTHDVVTLYTDQDDITGKKTFKKEIVLGGNVNSRPLLTGILQNGNSFEILTVLDVNAVSGNNKGFKLTNIKSISGLITPTANDQAVNKVYADTKVAKVTSSTTYEQAYTKLAGGAQSMRDISDTAIGGTIALRSPSGTLVISDPVNPGDATTKRYVDGLISTVYKPQGSATVTQLINLTKTSSMNGYVYNMSDSGTLVDYDGTQMAVLAGDNIVLIWNNSHWYWDKLAGTVDLTPYARKDASNVFTGEINTFNGHVLITGGARYLGVANIINLRKLWYQDQSTTGICDIEFAQTYIQINKELKNSLIPAVTNAYSIGNSSKQWVDIWFNGSLKDGDGRSLTLEQISAKYTKPSTGIPSSDLEDIHAVGTNVTKCKITYNSKGQVTNGQDLNYADIPALHTIIPTDNDLYDLGSNIKYWQNAYISRSIKFGTTSNSSLDIIYNINTSDTILTINKDYIQVNKSLRTAANVSIEANGLLYVGGQEIRFNDHVNFTDNTNEHNNILQLFNNDIIAWKTATFKSALNVDGLIWTGGKEIRFPDYVNFKDNTDQHNTILTIDQNYIQANKPLRTAANIAIEANGLLYAGGQEIRFGGDYLNITDNTNNHNTIVQVHKDYVNFFRQVTVIGNQLKVVATRDNNPEKVLVEFIGQDYDDPRTVFTSTLRANGSAEFNGLIWAGGREIRFPDYLEFKDNTNDHNTIMKIQNGQIDIRKQMIFVGEYFTIQSDNHQTYTDDDWDTDFYADGIYVRNETTSEYSKYRFPEPDGQDHTLATLDDITNLDASRITSGTFATARIPSLSASKITSGTFDLARIPVISTDKIWNIKTSEWVSYNYDEFYEDAIKYHITWKYYEGNNYGQCFYIQGPMNYNDGDETYALTIGDSGFMVDSDVVGDLGYSASRLFQLNKDNLSYYASGSSNSEFLVTANDVSYKNFSLQNGHTVNIGITKNSDYPTHRARLQYEYWLSDGTYNTVNTGYVSSYSRTLEHVVLIRIISLDYQNVDTSKVTLIGSAGFYCPYTNTVGEILSMAWNRWCKPLEDGSWLTVNLEYA